MYTKNIELLNKALADELAAVHQYLYFHFHCADQGFTLLSTLFSKTAMMEMRHVEKLSERILFLKGDVEMIVNGDVKKIHSVKEMLELAGEMESGSIKAYNHWANECSGLSDAVSRQLFEALIIEEEQHLARFGLELENIRKFGDNYLALQSVKRDPQQA